MLRGAAPFAEEEFKSYFTTIVFPQFTLKENIYSVRTKDKLKNTVCELPSMRQHFRRLFMGREHSNAQARGKLNELTLYYMAGIANGEFHPLARYNAMLLIADLNEDEATEKPYRSALIEMVNAISETDEAKRVRKRR